ncbi:hypothetical protein HD806DRAFT_540784 [Xylariaceae sp. AK1471]|nr:hypothetical protein HD806DRAFT_540784 [Xylariaceae sp. AK1471]
MAADSTTTTNSAIQELDQALKSVCEEEVRQQEISCRTIEQKWMNLEEHFYMLHRRGAFNAWIFEKMVDIDHDDGDDDADAENDGKDNGSAREKENDRDEVIDRLHQVWSRNPLRHAADRLCQTPGTFGDTWMARPGSNSHSASSTKKPDYEARRKFEKVCPTLGFSKWTGYLLLGPRMAASRESLRTLDSAMKSFFDPRPKSKTSKSKSKTYQKRGRSYCCIPPATTAAFLRELERARLQDPSGNSAEMNPGEVPIYMPKHVTIAIKVFQSTPVRHQEMGEAHQEEIEEEVVEEEEEEVEMEEEGEEEVEVGRRHNPQGKDLAIELFTPSPPVPFQHLSFEPSNPNKLQLDIIDDGNFSSPIFYQFSDANFNGSDADGMDDDAQSIDCPPLSSRISIRNKRKHSVATSSLYQDDEDTSRYSRRLKVDSENVPPELDLATLDISAIQPAPTCRQHGLGEVMIGGNDGATKTRKGEDNNDATTTIPTRSCSTAWLDLERTNRAIAYLKPRTWLNDDAVNLAIHQLVCRSGYPQVEASFAAVSSLLAAKIIKCSSPDEMAKLCQRYRKTLFDGHGHNHHDLDDADKLFPCLPDHLLMPVHWPSHWVLFYWNDVTHELTCFDSIRILQDPRLSRSTNSQLRWFLGLLYQHSAPPQREDDQNKLITSNCAQQNNGCDCGIWVISNAYRIVRETLALSGSWIQDNADNVDLITQASYSDQVRSLHAARFLSSPRVVPASLFTYLSDHAQRRLMLALQLRQYDDDCHAMGGQDTGVDGADKQPLTRAMTTHTDVRSVTRTLAIFTAMNDLSPLGLRYKEMLWAKAQLSAHAASLARLHAAHSHNVQRLLETRKSVALHRRQLASQRGFSRAIEALANVERQLGDVGHVIENGIGAVYGDNDDMEVVEGIPRHDGNSTGSSSGDGSAIASGTKVRRGPRTGQLAQLTGIPIDDLAKFKLALKTATSNVQLAMLLAPRVGGDKNRDKDNDDDYDFVASSSSIEEAVEDARARVVISLILVHRVAAMYKQAEDRFLELQMKG